MFGATGYATLMGRLAMPSLMAQAAAPSIGALLLERAGAKGLLGVLAAVAFLPPSRGLAHASPLIRLVLYQSLLIADSRR